MTHYCSPLGSFLLLLGRICLAVIFLNAGYVKIIAFAITAQTMAAKGVLYPDTTLVIATIFELGGAFLVLFGWYARFGALLLLAFTIAVTYYFHSFWTYEGATKVAQMAFFYKNLAIAGGLLYIMGAGAGRLSLDCLARKTCCVTK